MVRTWLHGASRVPLLTAAEEITLGRMIREWKDQPDPLPAVVRRGRRARDRMVSANLRLVAHIEPRCPIGGDRPDRLQAGSLGLITAAEKFDPEKGYKFSTYAYWWIRQRVTRYASSLPMASGLTLPGSWSWTDPRRDIHRVPAAKLDRPFEAMGQRNRALGEIIEGGSLNIDEIAETDELETALGAMREADPEGVRMLELLAEGMRFREVQTKTGAAVSSSKIERVRQKLRELPEVQAAFQAR